MYCMSVFLSSFLCSFNKCYQCEYIAELENVSIIWLLGCKVFPAYARITCLCGISQSRLIFYVVAVLHFKRNCVVLGLSKHAHSVSSVLRLQQNITVKSFGGIMFSLCWMTCEQCFTFWWELKMQMASSSSFTLWRLSDLHIHNNEGLEKVDGRQCNQPEDVCLWPVVHFNLDFFFLTYGLVTDWTDSQSRLGNVRARMYRFKARYRLYGNIFLLTGSDCILIYFPFVCVSVCESSGMWLSCFLCVSTLLYSCYSTALEWL